jgi:hypothetical protein
MPKWGRRPETSQDIQDTDTHFWKQHALLGSSSELPTANISADRGNKLDHFKASNLLEWLGPDDSGAQSRAFAEQGNKGLPS